MREFLLTLDSLWSHARQLLQARRADYNHCRPQGSLDGLSSVEFVIMHLTHYAENHHNILSLNGVLDIGQCQVNCVPGGSTD